MPEEVAREERKMELTEESTTDTEQYTAEDRQGLVDFFATFLLQRLQENP